MAAVTLGRATVARRAVARRLRGHRTVMFALVLALPLLWMLLLYLVPLVFLLINSVWKVENYQIVHVWTLDNYHRIFSDPVWLQVLLRTALMAAAVTATTVVLGM